MNTFADKWRRQLFTCFHLFLGGGGGHDGGREGGGLLFGKQKFKKKNNKKPSRQFESWDAYKGGQRGGGGVIRPHQVLWALVQRPTLVIESSAFSSHCPLFFTRVLLFFRRIEPFFSVIASSMLKLIVGVTRRIVIHVFLLQRPFVFKKK